MAYNRKWRAGWGRGCPALFLLSGLAVLTRYPMEIHIESGIPFPKSPLQNQRQENRRAIGDALLKMTPGQCFCVGTHYLLQDHQEVAKELGLKVVSHRVRKDSNERRIGLVEGKTQKEAPNASEPARALAAPLRYLFFPRKTSKRLMCQLWKPRSR
jgi:hypothetical protein